MFEYYTKGRKQDKPGGGEADSVSNVKEAEKGGKEEKVVSVENKIK